MRNENSRQVTDDARKNTFREKLAELSKDVEEFMAGLSPGEETTSEYEDDHYRSEYRRRFTPDSPYSRDVRRQQKKKKSKKASHESSRRNEHERTRHAAVSGNYEEFMYDSDEEKYEWESQSRHRQTTKPRKVKKSKNNTAALSPVVLDKSPPRRVQFPDSDSDGEDKEGLQMVSDMILHNQWRPDVFPKRLTVTQVPSLQAEKDMDLEQRQKRKKDSKHRYAHVELAEANRRTDMVIKPLDSVRKLPSIPPRCASPKITQEESSQFMTPRRMYKPLPSRHQRDDRDDSTPRDSYDQRAMTPKELYNKPVQSGEPVDLNGLLPKPTPPPKPLEIDEATAQFRKGLYKKVLQEVMPERFLPAPPERRRKCGRRRRHRKGCNCNDRSEEPAEVYMPAPPSQPRERHHAARPARMYKTVDRQDVDAPPHMETAHRNTRYLPVPPERPLSPERPRRLVRTMNREAAVSRRRLFQYEASDGEN